VTQPAVLLPHQQKPAAGLLAKPSPWVDLALTLPIFVLYQLGVVGLGVRNGTDVVTGPLTKLAEGNLWAYFGITLGGGVAFGLVLFVLGRGQGFKPAKLVQTVIEGIVYAVLMRLGASWVVGRMFAGPPMANDPFTGFIMSMGAGFYEELAFRVVLFGLGAKVLVWLFARKRVQLVVPGQALQGSGGIGLRGLLVMLGWAVVVAAGFSGMHYIGTYGDSLQLGSFVFRMLLGLALTLIYVTRGFAAAVWAHAIYDVWVIVL
jgi:hypothetical protein